MQQTILADHDDYQITLHRRETLREPLVLTFGNLPSRKTASGFGTDFLLKHGYDTIYVAQRAGTQYQGLPAYRFDEGKRHFPDRDLVLKSHPAQ